MTRMVLFFLFAYNLYGAPTELGNGNDGEDLVEFQEIKEGAIWDSRNEAVEFLSRINLRGIQGLGYLKDEVEKTKLYITKDGLSPQELLDLGAFKSGDNPVVYARTFPRPHAPTRFYPASKTLSKKKLIALHIHEGLHRSLPENIRRDEAIVEEITKVIISPNSTFEDIVAVMDKKLPQNNGVISSGSTLKNNVQFVVTNKYEFFADTTLSYGLNGYSSNMLLWNNAHSYEFGTSFYRTKDSDLKLGMKVLRLSGFEDRSRDTSILLRLAYEYTDDNFSHWSYELNQSGASSEISNNPLAKTLTSILINWKRDFSSYSLIAGANISFSSASYGSLSMIQDQDLEVEDDFYYDLYGRDIYEGEANFGGIYSLILGVEKQWSERLTGVASFEYHKMSGYSHSESEKIPGTITTSSSMVNRVVSVDSIPFVGVLRLKGSYKVNDFILNTEYFNQLNRKSINEIGEVSLTTLADPARRGLGTSGFNLSLAYQF